MLKSVQDSDPVMLYMKRDDKSAIYIKCLNDADEDKEDTDLKILLMEMATQRCQFQNQNFKTK